MNTSFTLKLFIARCCIALAALFTFSCDNDDDNPEPDNKGWDTEGQSTSGYVTSAITFNTGNSSYFAGYFNNVPSGAIDMTAKTAFTYFYPITQYRNAMYSQALDGTFALSKVVVGTDGNIKSQASIPMVDYVAGVKVINDTLGVYCDRGLNGKLFTFNPGTMEKTGEIDMTGATTIAGNEQNVYYVFAYRPQDHKLFATLYTNKSGTTQYYDATSIYAEVINMHTLKREKTTVHPDVMDPFSRGTLEPMVDEQGNIYFMAQGSYGLDGNMGPAAPAYAKPYLIKIPAGSTEFDQGYTFNPVNALNPEFAGLLVQLAVGMVYGGDGIGYACLSAKPYDNPRIYELLAEWAAGTISAEEVNELYQLVIYAPGLKWCKINLASKEVTEIEGIPFTAGFSYPNSYAYDGDIYFQTLNQDEGINGYYKYDSQTGVASSLFNVTAGGVAVSLTKLVE